MNTCKLSTEWTPSSCLAPSWRGGDCRGPVKARGGHQLLHCRQEGSQQHARPPQVRHLQHWRTFARTRRQVYARQWGQSRQ